LNLAQQLQVDVDMCYQKSKRFELTACSVLTFAELIDLLQPLAEQMDFKKAAQPEYRLDTVLSVQSCMQATHVAGARFKVSGVHFQMSEHGSAGDSLPVEVTLEAADEAKAQQWVL
jgi:hypothetical protein